MPLLALLLGYLWGSIPTARIVARLSGGDLGGGNVGTLNTIRRVGLGPGIAVATLDIAKGASAVLTARYLLDLAPLWVLFAGVFAVIGHNWMVWLGFKGGKGMAAATGAVAAASIIYGHAWVLAGFIGVILAVWRLGKNLVPGNAVGLICLPGFAWLASHCLGTVLAAIALDAVIAVKYAPGAIADFKRRGLGALGRDEIRPKRKG
ncbi:glycerol-3-phosphate acyltransferase PlsY [Dehalogenimonas formicexedens]|uniref:Glycerol-3-phosphate acyltransferase n=1 Tax=Dehalogenimonas formicexedens TaxID=1839801 RepID=A0A1P8F4L8_9CHLR|nr:glycerol-3-phosphate acyltransferase [Dehalogenimonas formicexedens]APV43388.1 glycerol-3-phosphate acyltransferase PlsY [Dehalogenimonas formicexedens]